MNDQLNQVSGCEVCGEQHLATVLDLGRHPMCDDLVAVGDARTCREYPIEILYCDTCRTAHQRYQVPKQELFPRSYHYRSRFTADVLNGMAGLVDSCEARFGPLSGKRVLDIGCNDGSLLDFFRKKGATTLGIEPTGACRDAEEKGHVTFNAFLSEELATRIAEEHGKPDIITFTNVFAHIEDLQAVLRTLRHLVSARTAVVIENHYLGAVLDGNQFDTFYHEHPRTYSYTSFVHIARALELELSHVEFPSRYGGNIRVFLSSQPPSAEEAAARAAVDAREGRFREQFERLSANLERWRASRRASVAEHVRQYGKLRAKAFPGRAAILIKLLGLGEESIDAVYEKPGSMKIGHYLPGTRVPIRSDDELFALADKSQPLLNLAWHIPQEIRSYLSQHGYTGPVIDIVSAADFERQR
ncbi:MAG TPA: class I SAM-dependent methyltransferase [Burkholderiales bacterium]|nr:class I SAM-dependent methyltransferase [Burkholderiales bacterium]